MIAKLVVWSEDRQTALHKLQQALRGYNVSQPWQINTVKQTEYQMNRFYTLLIKKSYISGAL